MADAGTLALAPRLADPLSPVRNGPRSGPASARVKRGDQVYSRELGQGTVRATFIDGALVAWSSGSAFARFESFHVLAIAGSAC